MSGGLSSGLGGLTRNLGSGTAGFLNAGIGAGSNLIGGTTERMMNGQEYSTADILWDSGSGLALSRLPDFAGASGSTPTFGLELGGASASQAVSSSIDTLEIVGKGTGLIPNEN